MVTLMKIVQVNKYLLHQKLELEMIKCYLDTSLMHMDTVRDVS